MKQRLIASKTNTNIANKAIPQARLYKVPRIGFIMGYILGYIPAGLRYGRLCVGYISRYAQGIEKEVHLHIATRLVIWLWLRSGMANPRPLQARPIRT